MATDAGEKVMNPFISKIRKSLGHSSNSDRTWETLVQKMPSCEDEHNRRLQTIRNRSHAEREALLDELIQAAGPLNLNVIPKPDIASVGAAIAEIVRKKSPEWGTQKSVVAWQHPLIQKLNLSETLAKQGVPVYYTAFGKNHGDPRSEIQEREKLREQVIASYIGITAADFCIAETATLVMKTRQGQARSVSLVPSVHIAVIESTQIIANLKELYSLLKWDPEQRAEGLSNCMTFISGPSKTADIEATLVHGAHGPRELYLFVLCEDGTSKVV